MKKADIKKEIKSWGIIGIILLTLYLTGLHTEVAAFAQRVVLQTGIISGEETIPTNQQEDVDYNLDLIKIDGTKISMNDFKGKVIFLNVWATWCAPCIAEMPGIQSLYEEIDNENIIFILLSMDKHIDLPTKFMNKKGYNIPTYVPASRVPEMYRAPSIPTTFVINKAGKIVSKKVGMAKYNSKSFKKFLLKQESK